MRERIKPGRVDRVEAEKHAGSSLQVDIPVRFSQHEIHSTVWRVRQIAHTLPGLLENQVGSAVLERESDIQGRRRRQQAHVAQDGEAVEPRRPDHSFSIPKQCRRRHFVDVAFGHARAPRIEHDQAKGSRQRSKEDLRQREQVLHVTERSSSAIQQCRPLTRLEPGNAHAVAGGGVLDGWRVHQESTRHRTA
ncbi:MAG: hypothetical protein WEB04_00510 [Dehalococcoidia bacterium]